jgi:tRNA threonylcarbamoyladenosine biosynthesis protein TsaE
MHHRQYQILSDSADTTRDIGRRMAAQIRTGVVLALHGELGSGKTCLVQGIAMGLQVPEDYYVTSPSYTLINEYPGRLPLIHVDLYRIENPLDLADIGLRDHLQQDRVIAIEWADRLDDRTLTEYISVDMSFVDDGSRKIVVTACGLKAHDLLKKFQFI